MEDNKLQLSIYKIDITNFTSENIEDQITSAFESEKYKEQIVRNSHFGK